MVDVKADLQMRLDMARKAMAEAGLGSLVVYASGQHNMLRMDQLFWLTDFRCIGPAVALLTSAGAPKILVSPEWDLERAKEAAGAGDCEAVTPERLPDAIRRLAKDLPQPAGLSGRDIMNVAFAEALSVDEFKDAEKLIPSLGATRTPAELERVEHAAKIADIGFQALCDTAHVGMREYELAAEIESAMQAAGSEDNFGLLAAGSHNVAIRPPTERKLDPGDLIVGEITPCYKGYFAQLCRTFILGDPSDIQKEKFDMLLEAQARGFEAVKPGQPSANISKAVNGVIAAAGYGEYCKQPYMRTRGHGLGFGGIVPYDITDESSPILRENMTFVIHPNQYIPETGYMMLGDTVVVEPDGPRQLTQTPRQLYWKES